MTSQSNWIHDVLLGAAMDKYYVEIEDRFTNHMAHGIIALYRLGASKDRVKRFVDFYATKLESPSKYDAENDISKDYDIQALLGEQKSFYILYNHYNKMLMDVYGGSIDKIINGEFPKLADGMIASACHGLIQIGYGLSERCERTVIEGFAYLHHSYLPIKHDKAFPPFGSGDTDITKILEEIRNDVDFDKVMELEVPPMRGFSGRIRHIFNLHSNKLIQYVRRIKLPEFFKIGNQDTHQAIDLCKWALDCAILVYATSERKNDFFLLHGVTAGWSLLQIVQSLKDYNQMLHCIYAYLVSLLAVYIRQTRPALNVQVNQEQPIGDAAWQGIIEEILSYNDSGEESEHRYKLVQVVNEMRKETKDPATERIYACAARSAIDYEFTF